MRDMSDVSNRRMACQKPTVSRRRACALSVFRWSMLAKPGRNPSCRDGGLAKNLDCANRSAGVSACGSMRSRNAYREIEPTTPAVAWHLERSEEHTSELQSLMRISYAVFCLKKKKLLRQYRNKSVDNRK